MFPIKKILLTSVSPTRAALRATSPLRAPVEHGVLQHPILTWQEPRLELRMARTRGTSAAHTLTRSNPSVRMSSTALHKSRAFVVAQFSTEGSAFSTGHSTFRTSTLLAASIQETHNCSAVATRYHTTATLLDHFHAQLAPHCKQVLTRNQ
jgi:hypothetical protein